MELVTGDILRVLTGGTSISTEAAVAARVAARLLPGQETVQRLDQAIERALAGLSRGAGDGPFSLQPVVEMGGAAEPEASRIRLRAFLRFHAGEAVLEIPGDAARAVASAVTGSQSLAGSDLLTALETGIISFFLERLVTAANAEVPELGGLTLATIGSENGEPEWGPEGGSAWRAVSGAALLAGQSVPFRLLLPLAPLAEARRQLDASGAGMRDGLRGLLRRLGDLTVEFGVRVGQVSLTAAELAGVEVNDIVLLDPAALSIEGGYPAGRATLTLARSLDSSGLIVGEVGCTDGRPCVRVEQIVAGNLEAAIRALEPAIPTRSGPVSMDAAAEDKGSSEVNGGAENDMSMNDGELHGEIPGGEAGSGAALLPELPVTLKIELSRISLTLGQLAELEPGAVLELRREANTTANLVVEDRVVGRGELLSVDGQLGIRVLALG